MFPGDSELIVTDFVWIVDKWELIIRLRKQTSIKTAKWTIGFFIQIGLFKKYLFHFLKSHGTQGVR